MAGRMQTEPLRRRADVVHYADIMPRSNTRAGWDRVRHRQAHWFVECAAEFVSSPARAQRLPHSDG